MKRFLFIYIALLVISSGAAASRRDTAAVQGIFLEALQKRDSILIADQFRYGVRLNDVKAGSSIALPDWSESFPADQRLVLLGGWQTDTVKTTGSRKSPQSHDIRASVQITSFDEGYYELPAIAVCVKGPDGKTDTLYFESKKYLDYRSMPVDTATYVPHDIKAQIRYPLQPAELIPYIAAFQLFALMVIGLVCFFAVRRRRSNGEYARKDPAHIVALRKLDRYRGDKMWEAQKQKLFYSGVTDALREYIGARYGVGAMEKTTKEIFDQLKTCDIPGDLYNELLELFTRADFVKFAKYVATREENSSVVPLAVRFVTRTYQQAIEGENDAQTNKKEA